jgi:lincosamide nucleotidyltransferase B/F
LLPQRRLIDRLRELSQADERVAAAMLYGSFALGRADAYSDIDSVLFFHRAALAGTDERAWVSQIAPLHVYYRNEFGNGVAIFTNLVRAEFHFYAVDEMGSQLAGWRGRAWFPSAEHVILVDKTGQLARHLEPLIGPPPRRDTPAELRRVADSYFNWYLFSLNLYARADDNPRALELLFLIQDDLLRMARVLEGQVNEWVTPTRRAERDLSAAAYERYRACTAPLEREALGRAYRAAWHWGSEMLRELAARHAFDLDEALLAKIGTRLERYAPA